jgi:hypothetical protein
MHIKNIHSMIEKLSECAKCELDKGIEKIDTKEMGEVAEMLKELCEAEYYAKISKAMDEYDFEDAEEIMEEGRRGYRGQPRDSRGRYMRRGYDEMMYMPEMYRDMDRESMGKMYYTSANRSQGSQGGSSMGSSNGGSMGYSEGMRGYSSQGRDSREGRSGQSRRSYMETKEMHKGNTQQDKDMKLKELDKYMNELSSDISEMIQDSSNEEKTMLKQKLNGLVQKIQ